MIRVRVPVGLVRDPSLPAEVKLTYLVLATYCENGSGRCSLKRRDLMKAVGVRSPTTMRGYLRVLADRGWLEFQYVRSGRQTAYVLHDVDRERMEAELAEMKRHLESADFKGVTHDGLPSPPPMKTGVDGTIGAKLPVWEVGCSLVP